MIFNDFEGIELFKEENISIFVIIYLLLCTLGSLQCAVDCYFLLISF